jgi:hypothetical protein
MSTRRTRAQRQGLLGEMEQLARKSVGRSDAARRLTDVDSEMSAQVDAAVGEAMNAPKASTSTDKSARRTSAPPKGTLLKVLGMAENVFKSAYFNPPEWRDSESTTTKAFQKKSPGWLAKEYIPHPQGRRGLQSTIPELYKPDLNGSAVAVEVKDVALRGGEPNYQDWALQLAQRTNTIKLAFPKGNPLQNWLVADLRGLPGEVNLTNFADQIKVGVARAGRVGGKPGPTFDKVFFILDDKIVQMP